LLLRYAWPGRSAKHKIIPDPDRVNKEEPRVSRAFSPVIAFVADLFFAAKVRGAAQAAGANALTVHTPEHLLEEIRDQRPNLVLIDLDARGADGSGLIRQLKSDPATATLRVIAFASHVQTDAIRSAQAAGADRVLARSAFVRELPTLIQEAAGSG
jgi:CheY-like chemotaxis protein